MLSTWESDPVSLSCNAPNIAFCRMKLLPIFFPFLQSFQIILQLLTVICGRNSEINDRIIGKQDYLGVFSILWHIIDDDKEEDQPKDLSLEHSTGDWHRLRLLTIDSDFL